MAVAQTLKEIALEKAKKRPELVDYLTEEAPILTLLKWIPATHGLWNVEEVLDKITGASFTDLGAPLPTMQAETQLRQTYVSLMGGEFESMAKSTPPKDDDAIEVTLAATQASRIVWLQPDRSALAFGTEGSEWTLEPSEGVALTPATASFWPGTCSGTWTWWPGAGSRSPMPYSGASFPTARWPGSPT